MALQMEKNGDFTLTMGPEELSRGLRPTRRIPRNMGFMEQCAGAVGRDGVLQTLDLITPISQNVITDGFPYPMLLVLTNIILVLGETKIYSYSGSTLTSQITGLTAGVPWTVADFKTFLYLSNGKQAVTQDPSTHAFSVNSGYPFSTALCNFNGQVLAGSPNVSASGVI